MIGPTSSSSTARSAESLHRPVLSGKKIATKMKKTNQKNDVAHALSIAFSTFFLLFSGTGPSNALNGAQQSPHPSTETGSGDYLAGITAWKSTDPRRAAFFLRNAFVANPGDPSLTEQAFVASLAAGDLADAFEIAGHMAHANIRTELGDIALAAHAFKERDYLRAIALTSRFNAGAFQAPMLFLQCWALLGAGNADAALELLDQIKDKSASIMRDYQAALISELRGYSYEAKKRWRSVATLDPRNLRLNEARAQFALLHGGKAEAEAIYRRLLSEFPRHPVIQSALDDLNAGRPRRVIVSDAIVGAGDVLFQYGSAIAARDPFTALSFLRLSIYLGVTDGNAEASIGDIYNNIKRYQDAIDAYRSIPQTSALRVAGDNQIARALFALEDNRAAITQINSAIFFSPHDPALFATRGDIERTQQNWSAAIDAYSRAIELIGAPTAMDWRLLYVRAIAYDRAKDWARAEADLKQALALAPDEPALLNYLAYGWADRGVNLDQSLAMLKKTVSLEEKNGAYVDSLGWVYFRLGKYREAIGLLEQAVQLLAGNAEINEHLGDAYFSVGRRREAAFQWRIAVDLKPDPESVARLRHKLDENRDKPEINEETTQAQ